MSLNSAKLLFDEIDSKKIGHIQIDQLRQYLLNNNIPTTPSLIQNIFSIMDLNNDGKLTCEEFEQFFIKQTGSLQQLFSKIDVDQNGFVELSEVRSTLKNRMTQSQIDFIFKQIDNDNDQKITQNEFIRFFLLLPQLSVEAIFEQCLKSQTIESIGESAVVPAESKKDCPAYVTIVAGGIAGAISRTLTSPLDRLKTIMQSQSNNQGFLQGMVQIYKKDGMKGYFRGNGTNVIKIAPETAFRFLFYDKIHDLICRDKSNSGAFSKFTAGSLAGVFSTIITFPFDLAKTKLSLTAPDYYKGMIDCLNKTLKSEGVRGWFNGLKPTLAGAIPFQGINQMIYNEIKEYYCKNYEEAPSSFTMSLFGGFSTLIAQIVTYPFCVAKSRMQSQGLPGFSQNKFTSMTDCLIKVYQMEGFKGYFFGLGPCILKALPATMLSFGIYEYIKGEMLRKKN